MLKTLTGLTIKQFILRVPILELLKYSKLIFREMGVVKVTEGVHDMGPINIKSGVLVSRLVSMSMAPEISVIDMNSGASKTDHFH